MKLFLNILLILFLPLTIYAIIQNTKGTMVYNVKAERFSPVEESEQAILILSIFAGRLMVI